MGPVEELKRRTRNQTTWVPSRRTNSGLTTSVSSRVKKKDSSDDDAEEEEEEEEDSDAMKR